MSAQPAPESLVPVAKPQDKRPPLVIGLDQLKLFEQRNNDWHIVLPEGTQAADIHMRSAPFAAIADRLLTGDRVVAVTADSRFMYQCVVVFGTQERTALVYVQNATELPDMNQDAPPPEGYRIRRVKANENQPGWIVERTRDQWVMNLGNPLLSELEARLWLNNHAAVRAEQLTRAEKARLG